MSDKESEIIEITLAKACGEIGDSRRHYKYCDGITENLLSHGLITEHQCESIRSGETCGDKNQ